MSCCASIWEGTRGVCAFIRRDIPLYLFLRSQFVFFDYTEPLIFFFADYLAVMVLFAAVGLYISRILKRNRQKKANQSREEDV